MDRGVVVVETFQPFTVDQVYRPYNCDILQVIMDEDGTLDQRILSCTAGALFGNPQRPEEYGQLARYFESPELQMATFTITEKGYALRNAAGELFPYVAKEIADGPAGAASTMGIVAALLLRALQRRRRSHRAGLYGQLLPKRPPLPRRRAHGRPRLAGCGQGAAGLRRLPYGQ